MSEDESKAPQGWLKSLLQGKQSGNTTFLGTDSVKLMVRALNTTIVQMLETNKKHIVESPSLQPEIYRRAIERIIQNYHQALSYNDERKLSGKALELITLQRKKEFEYFELKEEELKAIIAFIFDEIEGSIDENKHFDSEMTSVVKELKAAVEPEDIRQIRQKFAKGLARLSESLEAKQNQNEKRIQELKDQVEILSGQLDMVTVESKTDALTKLYNRGAFDVQFLSEVNLARRLKRPLSLILLDLDHFKQINDEYGHSAGDAILIQFSDLLSREFFRKTDFCARYGGEEFAVILSQVSLKGATSAAERLVQKTGQTKFCWKENPIPVTVSAGVVSFCPSERCEDLVTRADKALYKAKEEGRNRAFIAASPK